MKHLPNTFTLPALTAMLTLTWSSLPLTGAPLPAPEKLLPDDTLVMVTIPDVAKARALYQASPQTQLWRDPAMKPLRDQFLAKLDTEIVKPLERDLGVNFTNYASLPQGQLTFAITENGWAATPGQSPGFLLLLDAGNRGSQLRTNLAEIRRKWLDSGKALKTEKIRDLEFTLLPLSARDIPPSLKKFYSSEDAGEDAGGETNQAPGAELVFGQFESLLIAGNSTKAVEKVVVHLTGGSMPALGDLASYESSRTALFRDAPLYGWVNAKTLVDLFSRQSPDKASRSANPMAALFNMQKFLAATGLSGLRTLAFNLMVSPDGTSGQFALGVPEASRQGLFKLFPAPGKESSPPPFVPADAVKFSRVRIDGQQAWATLQAMLTEISPEITSSLNFILDTANEAAKQKDPNFDLRKNLFGNLGDDFITYQKAPKGATLVELAAAPSLTLIGSPQPEQFANALKSILVLMNPSAGNPKEREFLGRKIYSLPAPGLPLPQANAGATADATLSYAASGSYVALTTDAGLLEEFLRSGESEQKQLRETPGLAGATARIGGGSTGWFTYENQAEVMRSLFEALRKGATEPKATEMLAPGIPAFTPENPFKEWLDFSLLPPFEQIAKYFSFAVYSGATDADGLNFKFYSPVPAELRK